MSSPKASTKRRDWKKYNNALVSRAKLFLDPKVLRNWKRELRRMNRRKNGRSFIYPPCFIEYLSLIQGYFRFSYRAIEDVMGFLSKYVPLLAKPDHSTIHRRMSKLNLDFNKSVKHRKSLIVSIDSSGLKVHNRGEWIRHKHKVRRGYLKIHFAVNAKTREIVDLESTKEEVHDNRRFRPMVKRLLKKYTVKKILGDAAYDDHRNFNLLENEGIVPAIKVKKNSLRWKWHPKWDRKHRVRRKYVIISRFSYDEWKRRLDYGKRWVSEIVFSSFKANFGEYFASKKMENIKREILRKAYVHNILVNHLLRS